MIYIIILESVSLLQDNILVQHQLKDVHDHIITDCIELKTVSYINFKVDLFQIVDDILYVQNYLDISYKKYCDILLSRFNGLHDYSSIS